MKSKLKVWGNENFISREIKTRYRGKSKLDISEVLDFGLKVKSKLDVFKVKGKSKLDSAKKLNLSPIRLDYRLKEW